MTAGQICTVTSGLTRFEVGIVVSCSLNYSASSSQPSGQPDAVDQIAYLRNSVGFPTI